MTFRLSFNAHALTHLLILFPEKADSCWSQWHRTLRHSWLTARVSTALSVSEIILHSDLCDFGRILKLKHELNYWVLFSSNAGKMIVCSPSGCMIMFRITYLPLLDLQLATWKHDLHTSPKLTVVRPLITMRRPLLILVTQKKAFR